MPFFTADHVRHALSVLPAQTHPSLISFLAMVRDKVPLSATPSKAFGSAQEKALLKDYFCPEGGPAARPWYVPFGKPIAGSTFWKPKEYAGTSLQRMRTGKKFFYKQGAGSSNDLWSIEPNMVPILTAQHDELIGAIPQSVHNLAVWCYRELEFASHAQAIEKFIEEFELRPNGLVSAIFDDTPDPKLASIPLAPASLTSSHIFSLLVPPASVAAALGAGTTITSVDADPDDATWDVDRADILNALTGLQGIDEAAFRAMSALRAGMHVIFTGPPGTGKTQLAQRLCQASGIPWTLAAATDQWTTIDTIGGYFPSATSAGQLDFLPGFVTNAIANRRTLIVDEINRADIDKAFGELFTLLSGNSVDLPYLKRVDTDPPSTRRIKLGDEETPDDPSMEIIRRPSWWRLIGSMNDADKASLKRLSYAFIRRFAFIPVDVPPRATYEALIDSGAGAGADGLAATRPDYLVILKALFADPAGLASFGMAMGYAVPEAMMRHARSELAFEPTRQTDDLLASSLELFVAPQFQARADKHEEFLKIVGQHLKTPTLLSRFGSRLSVWTGYVD